MIGAIEQGIIDRILLANGEEVLGYKLRSVTSYRGEFDDRIDQSVQKFPAVWVAFAGAERPQARSKGAWNWPMRFAVVVAARNRRNERSQRHGDSGDPGSYQILVDIAAILLGQIVAECSGELEPFSIRGIASDAIARRKLSIYVLELRTLVPITARNLPSELADLERINVDWDVPPFDPEASPPLDDGEADATDNIELETS